MTTIATQSASWPTFGISGITFVETVDGPRSPEEEFRNDGSRAVRTFFVRWKDRQAAVRALVGYPEIKEGANTGKYIARNLPDAHPDWLRPSDNEPFLFCTQIQRIEGWGKPDSDDGDDPAAGEGAIQRSALDVSRYSLARISAVYESLTYEIKADSEIAKDDNGNPVESNLDRYVTILVTPSAEQLQVPNGKFFYVDGNSSANPVPGFPQKLQGKNDISLTWHSVPTRAVGMRLINREALDYPIDSYIGSVNSTTFADCRPGTLLLTAAQPRPIRSPTGERTWDIEFRFLHIDLGDDANGNPIGHNWILRYLNGVQDYFEISIDTAVPTPSNFAAKADGKNLYNWNEFANLFQVPI